MSDTTERNQAEGEHVPERNGETYVTYKALVTTLILSVLFNTALAGVAILVAWTLIDSHRDAGHKGTVYFTEINSVRDDIREVKNDVKDLEKLHREQAADPNIMKEIRRFDPQNLREMAKER